MNRIAAAAATMLVGVGTPLAAEPALPDFDPGAFATPAPNRYFPLEAGQSFVMRGGGTDDGVAVTEESRVTVTGPGPVVMGIPTTQILDEEWENGRLTERTLDLVATDDAGNVWYFGEDVTNYAYGADGTLLSQDTDGSWRAGDAGARPGILVPGTPAVGQSYLVGLAPEAGEADYVEVVALDAAVTGPAGSYAGVLKLRGGSADDPDEREFKFFAPDVGLVREEDGLSADFDRPAFTAERQP